LKSINKVSISPTFYERLFLTKVLCAAFIELQFGFCIFWRKNISAKAACKMLSKLSTGPLRTLVHQRPHGRDEPAHRTHASAKAVRSI